MKKLSLYPILVILAAMATSATLTHLFLFKRPIRIDSDYTKNISPQIGNWSVIKEHKPSESEYMGLETRDIIKRTYTDGFNYVDLVVAYIAQSNRKSAHAQEACLRGGGAHVANISDFLLTENLDVRNIAIDYSNRRSHVFYWYKMGENYSSDFLKSSFDMFLKGLFRETNQGTALIRLMSTQRPNETALEVQKLLQGFGVELIHELNKTLP